MLVGDPKREVLHGEISVHSLHRLGYLLRYNFDCREYSYFTMPREVVKRSSCKGKRIRDFSVCSEVM